MNSSQCKGQKMKCESYMLQDRKLCKENYERIYLKCLGREEAREALEQYHDKYGIVHGSKEATVHQILRSRYL